MTKPNLHTTSGKQWAVLKPAARSMRHEATAAEDRLWQALRNGSLGVRFRRQHAIGRFIADFFCPKARIAIEVDGASHDGMDVKDAERDSHIEAHGIRVLRVTNGEVMTSLASVVERIKRMLDERADPQAPLPGERGTAEGRG
jgi:very-short-patch-repair endonuclease